MKFIEKIIVFIKQKFSKEDKVKRLKDKGVITKDKFSETLKVDILTKGKIETRVCIGNGLGIKGKMLF